MGKGKGKDKERREEKAERPAPGPEGEDRDGDAAPAAPKARTAKGAKPAKAPKPEKAAKAGKAADKPAKPAAAARPASGVVLRFPEIPAGARQPKAAARPGSWGACTPEQCRALDRISAAVDARLSGRRLEHVHGVALTCGALAARYGVDAFAAQAAGLLHDWDKQLPLEELWAKVDAFGLAVPRDDRYAPLLHSWTAAASLPLTFPELPPEVFRAVGRHTVGAVDMTPLDMALFVADMVEPTRTGDHVNALRALVGTAPLEGVYAACLRQSILYVLETGRYLHPGAVESWNAWCSELPGD